MLSAHCLQYISWENAKLNPIIALEKVSLFEVERDTARVNVVQGRGVIIFTERALNRKKLFPVAGYAEALSIIFDYYYILLYIIQWFFRFIVSFFSCKHK